MTQLGPSVTRPLDVLEAAGHLPLNEALRAEVALERLGAHRYDSEQVVEVVRDSRRKPADALEAFHEQEPALNALTVQHGDVVRRLVEAGQQEDEHDEPCQPQRLQAGDSFWRRRKPLDAQPELEPHEEAN